MKIPLRVAPAFEAENRRLGLCYHEDQAPITECSMRRILATFLGLSLLYLGLGYTRSEIGLIHAFDSGIYLQILSNLAAGRGWASSIVQESQFLAHHFQPIVALLVPLHAVSGQAWMLLLVGWRLPLSAAFAS